MRSGKDYGDDLRDLIASNIALGDLVDDYDEDIAQLEAEKDDLKIQLAELKHTGSFAPAGPRVRVFTPEGSLELCTGWELPGRAPWAGWHRIIPDNGYIDLTPGHRIEPLT